MKGNRAALTAAVIVGAVLLGWWLFGRGGDVARIDLLSTFDAARKQPDASLFSIADVTLGNETKRSIAIAPSAGSRITWKVRVPDDGWLWVSLGMKPDTIFLLSDGAFPPTAADAVRKHNPGKKVTVNTISFLNRFGEPLLQQIANENNGTYRFVP